MFNNSKLRGIIREVYRTESEFASAMSLSKATMSAKLNGSSSFNQPEIVKAASLLRIPPEKIPDIFFDAKVEKTIPRIVHSSTHTA